jgi:ferric-dicitrate binding protein FerR (iron transport regulator)
MEIRFEHLTEMPPAERAQFLREIAANETLRRAYAMWLVVSERIRSNQEDLIGDRTRLVLSALQRAGLESALSDQERALVADSVPYGEAGSPGRQLMDDVQRHIAGEVADFEESWKLRVHHLAPYRPVDRKPHGARPYVQAAWRASAVVAVFAFVAILLYVAQRDTSWIERTVSEGEVETVALADGSSLRIIGPTSIQYRSAEDGQSRPEVVRLSGDAFFDIIPSQSRFVVETATATVTVVGTSFGVRSRASRTDVVVASGRVSVASRAASTDPCLLSPGESCYVVQDAPPSAPEQVDLGDALAWANLFVFRATPMSQVAAALSRHYGVDVVVDPSLADETITGTFDSGRMLGEILNVLAKALGASVVETESGFRVTKAQR